MNADVPVRWLTDATMLDLSGGAFTAHLRAIMYGVEHETDGVLPAKALRLLLPHDAESSEVIAELMDADLWEAVGSDFRVLRWAESQTTKAEMEKRRAGNAERQRRFQKGKRDSDALVTQPSEVRRDQVKPDEARKDQTSVTASPEAKPKTDSDGWHSGTAELPPGDGSASAPVADNAEGLGPFSDGERIGPDTSKVIRDGNRTSIQKRTG